MASSTILSLCRRAFLPSLSPAYRLFSSAAPRLQYEPLSLEVPSVKNNTDSPTSVEARWNTVSVKRNSVLVQYSMLNPYSGRTVSIRKSVPDSLRVLDGVLARNRVRYQLRLTERHEKKGYKRRRLESERWRNQFANEVRKKVQLVMKMRDRGA